MSGAPASLQPGEKLWRMIEYAWFQPDANGRYVVLEAAFIGSISLARANYVSESDADCIKDRSGNFRFIKHGIAVLDADSIKSATGGNLIVTADSFGWPKNTHIEFRRRSGGKDLRASHFEVSEFVTLANSNPLVRLPKP